MTEGNKPKTRRQPYTKTCEQCKEAYYPKQKTTRFCSKKCSGISRRGVMPSRRTRVFTPESRSCKQCGEQFMAGCAVAYFCGRSCSAKWNRINEPTEKVCSICSIVKPITDFYVCRSRGNRLARCKFCQDEHRKAKGKKYKPTNPERHAEVFRNWKLLTTYGLTAREYDEILAFQDGGCAICGKTPEENGRRLVVDHCHTLGGVRGLLCCRCNPGLGNFKDTIQLLRNAIEYLDGERGALAMPETGDSLRSAFRDPLRGLELTEFLRPKYIEKSLDIKSTTQILQGE